MFRHIKKALNGSGKNRERADGGVVAAASADSRAAGEHSADTSAHAGSVEHAAPPIDNVFDILKNQRRRYVLRYLTGVDSEVTLGELAEQIAAWECEKDVRQITSQERKRVYVGLYQCHLPKMDDVDAVKYNKPRGKVAAGDAIASFQQYLPRKRQDNQPPRPSFDAIRELFR
ncbi:MAG: hypothetical protein ABEI98_00775 [Halorhabdus sp.]